MVDDTQAPRRGLRIVIVGAGMAGLLAAIRLKEHGYEDVLVLEKADQVAGTWRENRYPGLTCDIPSHAYTYSFEPNPDWSRRYPPGPEIFAYFEGIARRHGLLDRIRFGQEVSAWTYESAGGWTLRTADGATERADAVIMATGVLHHPRLPDIPGLDSFGGEMFHSARWDHDVALDGRAIGVIGSGSTGVQIVSALAGRASALTHFQRTPQWIMPTVNTEFTEDERAAFRADTDLIRRLHSTPEFAESLRAFSRAVTDSHSPEIAAIEARVLKNLVDTVRDPVLREKLRPSYRAACKRMIMSPDYYEKVQLPGVEVVTEPIAGVEPAGVRT